ncbi:MAG: hypothetical protein L0229_16395 [Blastocatellia bacterium]|nr:hypothetical protein [Blastocatellia bacterium]
MSFTDIFQSGFRLREKVCILAPGPNGKGCYGEIPSDFQVIAVSKAVLIPEVRAELWMMNHVGQDWYDEADSKFEGVRVFMYEAAMKAEEKSLPFEARLAGKRDCYYFEPPDEALETGVCLPVDGFIRIGATVSACALQFAYNFGASEILLCGVDMSGDGYFDDTSNAHPNHGETWSAVERMNPLIKWMTEERGLKIFTLSRTKLDVPAIGRMKDEG